MNACFHYHFHPVGQGLFASGCLYESNAPQPRFLWVYDCGSVTERIHWSSKVAELKRFVHGKAEIDLLMISHFDKDHISGIVPLLKGFKVKVLLLPYVPLWKRLRMAFQDGVNADDPLMEFYLDPVRYLRGIDGASIDRVLIVQPGGEGDAAGNDPHEPDVSPGEGSWTLAVRTKKGEHFLDANSPVSGEAASDPLEDAVDAEFLPSGEVISVRGLWEFVPYNAPRDPLPDKFFKKVNSLRAKLLDASKPEVRAEALGSLKAVYDKYLGTGSRRRNLISLFLYSGPVYSSWEKVKLLRGEVVAGAVYPLRYPCHYRVNPEAPGFADGRCSMLYSGDGYLQKVVEFENLKRLLGNERMGRLGAFQVNHHGARGNWHKGLAKKLSPIFSVFCSEPDRGGTYHPHAEVLRDFWPHLPVQVNRVGFSLYGWLVR